MQQYSKNLYVTHPCHPALHLHRDTSGVWERSKRVCVAVKVLVSFDKNDSHNSEKNSKKLLKM